ncbi:hypothetical protein EXIGLDRAFT_744548 [Exidia glandulosa HHB12029]|uniref:Uncharacterized protein n=1 Tax=Exidia glandulosa HHB12029 TaxID=1314781 RepID=A0A165PLM2_EXIGL|nr:hypothetical protein EXIGLDRAFT_744548 [Exidia glandulosa HHB12029]
MIRGGQPRTTMREGIDLWLAGVPKPSLTLTPPHGAQLPVVLAASDFPSVGHGAFALLLIGAYTLRVCNGPPSNSITQLSVDADGYLKGAFGRSVVLEALRMLVRVGSPSGQITVRPSFAANPTISGSVREIILLYMPADGGQRAVSHTLHSSTYSGREVWRH